MVAEGLRYHDALKLIEALKQSGIDANITVGGICVDPKLSEVALARSICEKHGACVHDGNLTLQQEMILEGIKRKE